MLVRSLMSLMRRCAISGNFINRVCDSVVAGVEVSAHVVVIYMVVVEQRSLNFGG